MATFDRKVALVTGGTLGIGRATVIELARRGASVVVSGRDVQRGEGVAREVRDAGGHAIFHPADVSSEREIEGLVNAAMTTFNGVDILINNAALKDPEIFAKDSFATLEVDVWDKIMAVNLRSAALTCKYAIPEMIKRGGGAIVNTSSAVAILGLGVIPAYAVSKAALNALTQNIAIQFGKQGVRCNSVVPGTILVPETTVKKLTPAFKQVQLDNVLVPYLGQPEDVANTIAFLVSDDARYITAQCLAVDGGLNSHAPSFVYMNQQKGAMAVSPEA